LFALGAFLSVNSLKVAAQEAKNAVETPKAESEKPSEKAKNDGSARTHPVPHPKATDDKTA